MFRSAWEQEWIVCAWHTGILQPSGCRGFRSKEQLVGALAPMALALQPGSYIASVSAHTIRGSPNSPFLQVLSSLVSSTRKDHCGHCVFAKQMTIWHDAWGQGSFNPVSTRMAFEGGRGGRWGKQNPSTQREAPVTAKHMLESQF